MNRVLVFGFSNNLAGTESVVANYVSKCERLRFDILSYEPTPNYAALFSSGKNRLMLLARKSKNPIAYKREIVKIFQKYSGDYSAIWCNFNSYSNIDTLELAYRYGISRRIIHAHNSMPVGGLRTRILSRVNRRRAMNLATDYWACSEVAGRYFYGNNPYTILPNAIDYDACTYSEASRMSWRNKLGIQKDTFVIGTLCRLTSQKNLLWLIDMFHILSKKVLNCKLIIAGEGEDRDILNTRIRELSLDGKAVLIGSVLNSNELLSAFDVFVLPSLFEGLPLALLEAQANGLPCIVSDRVSIESVISDSCRFVPLNDIDAWTNAVIGAHRKLFDPHSKIAEPHSLDAQSKLIEKLLGGLDV